MTEAKRPPSFAARLARAGLDPQAVTLAVQLAWREADGNPERMAPAYLRALLFLAGACLGPATNLEALVATLTRSGWALLPPGEPCRPGDVFLTVGPDGRWASAGLVARAGKDPAHFIAAETAGTRERERAGVHAWLRPGGG